MRAAYIDRDLSFRKMAAEAGCGLRTITRWMQIHGIKADPTKRLRNPPPPKLGAERHSWRGDDIGYTQAHNRVRYVKGRARDHACQHCGAQAQQWAYDHLDPAEKTHRGPKYSVPYSLDIERYFPLCIRCHVNFDNKAARCGSDDVAREATPA